VFEAVGLDTSLVNEYFTNTPHFLGGTDLNRIESDLRWHHSHAFSAVDEQLNSLGVHRYRKGKYAEAHIYDPDVIRTLQAAVWDDDRAQFESYSHMVENSESRTIRSLLDFRYDCCTPIPIEEVEPVQSIVKRFSTGAMSYGSISREAHECMAMAMNRLGGKSNSGEGGELPERFYTSLNSAIKQVASARFA